MEETDWHGTSQPKNFSPLSVGNGPNKANHESAYESACYDNAHSLRESHTRAYPFLKADEL